MAVNGIIITTNNTKGNDILTPISQAENLVATLPVIVDQMVQYIDGDGEGTDYTALENRYGIPAGQGEAVYNLMTGLKAAIADDSAVQQAVYRLG